ncbi:MAG: small multi-drug export protein [Planctomycetota bacterium]
MTEKQPRPSLFHLFVPFGALAAALVAAWWAGVLGAVLKAAVASFFVLGKLIILSGAVPDDTFGLTAWELAGMVLFMDLLYAYLLAFNLDWAYRVRTVGPWLKHLADYCKYWLHQQPWMRRFAFSGVMAFVMFPLTGTGAPGGSILGRLVGLTPRVTLSAIATGSALGCGLMAAFAAQLRPFFEEVRHTLWFKASGLLILAIVVIVLIWLGRRVSRAAEDYAESTRVTGGDA